jgi:hypothetical protein
MRGKGQDFSFLDLWFLESHGAVLSRSISFAGTDPVFPQC